MTDNQKHLNDRLEHYTANMEAAREQGDFPMFEYWESEVSSVTQMIKNLDGWVR